MQQRSASSSFLNVNHLLKNNKIMMMNHKMAEVIKNYLFVQIAKESDFENNPEIHKNIKKSSIIVINQYEEKNGNQDNKYFIIGFKQTLISIKQSSIDLIHKLLIICPNLTIYFMNNTKDYFEQYIKIPYKTLEPQKIFESEIFNFKKNVGCYSSSKIFDQILSCITARLIQEGYLKTYEDRREKFKRRAGLQNKTITFNKYDLVYLRNIASSGSAVCDLYYHIDEEQLFAVKTNYTLNDKLIKREMKIYENLNHPFIPIFYGVMKVQEINSLVIEFINGQTLKNIEKLNLNEDDKIEIIINLCLIFIIYTKRIIFTEI